MQEKICLFLVVALPCIPVLLPFLISDLKTETDVPETSIVETVEMSTEASELDYTIAGEIED